MIFLLNPIFVLENLLNAYPKIIAFNLISEIAKEKLLRRAITNSKTETLRTALLNAFEKMEKLVTSAPNQR